MSGPLLDEKKAEYINFSFLAVLASRAITAILDATPPGPEELQALPKAERFLRDISSGAAFVTTGNHVQGFDAVRSVNALDFAMGPMETLEQLLVDKDIASYFGEVAAAVSRSENLEHALTENERSLLEFASNFFSALYESLTWMLTYPGEKEPSFDGDRYALAV